MKAGDRIRIGQWADERPSSGYPRVGDVFWVTSCDSEVVWFGDRDGRVVGMTAVSSVEPAPEFLKVGQFWTEVA